VLPPDYPQPLIALKERIRQGRLRVVMSANAAIILLHRDLGRTIPERQEQEGCRTKVIEGLSADLRREFPDVQELSPRTLKCSPPLPPPG
jgi:hypothetical protein